MPQEYIGHQEAQKIQKVLRTHSWLLCFFVATLAWSLLWISAGAQSDERSYDVVIRHGRVLDGAGNPWIPTRTKRPFLMATSAYVRTKRTLTLEEAIRKMTSWPATRMRLNGRGLIKEGCWADVVVFDFDKIQDRATYENPLQYSEGIDYVLVNGQVVIDQGKHTGARPGHVLYGPGRAAGVANE